MPKFSVDGSFKHFGLFDGTINKAVRGLVAPCFVTDAQKTRTTGQE